MDSGTVLQAILQATVHLEAEQILGRWPSSQPGVILCLRSDRLLGSLTVLDTKRPGIAVPLLATHGTATVLALHLWRSILPGRARGELEDS